ncbi:hypothetical protein D6856_09025 [Butyrivibrio sp. XB500-5]|uniref:hypothetical protein n=1 Tax=Butyrivibrio sp. XB500-5 TaxID=2364880 RepID=UPI000EAACA31|nr:hypothetical protein [Butyrivibrio sp. XB500-5]RKM60205.1 hypothetical protein D6856_09025 [Butyrivibrio sp. XB500-5]
MKRKTILIPALIMAVTALAACSFGNEQENVPSSEASLATTESNSGDMASELNSSDDTAKTETDDEQVPDSDFFSYELKAGKTVQVDLGSDGTPDTITLSKEHSDKFGIDFYTLKVNDQTIDILSEDNAPDFQTAKCYYVHKEEYDCIFASLEGDASKREVTDYMWNGASLDEDERVSGSKYYGIDENTGSVQYTWEMEVIEKWEVATDLYFVSDGLTTADKIQTITNPKALTLKQDVTFDDDESGEGPRSAKAGDKVYPTCIAYNNNVMGFADENGESLGYLYVSDVEEKDLFEK